MLLFLPAAGCYSSLVSNSLLASKLAINQLVEWKQQLNERYFAHLLCIFGLPLVELFAKLLMMCFGEFNSPDSFDC